jgi:multicomponent Na+:H+ antiporter subunit A
MATFLIVHAFYKAGLFLVVGILDKKAGSREADRLAGLGPAMPLTWLVAALAAASMAGLPPFLGFLGKETLYEGALHAEILPYAVLAAALLAKVMMIAIAGAVGLAPFVGEQRSPKPEPSDGPLAMWIGPAALGVGGLLLGLFASWTSHALVGPLATAVLGRPVEVHLSFWHGITAPLILSLVTFALGFLLYTRLRFVRERLVELEDGEGAGALPGVAGRVVRNRGLPRFEAVYDGFLAGLGGVARATATRLQSGLLTVYLRITLGVMAAMTLMALMLAGGAPRIETSAPPGIMVLVVALIALASAILPFTGKRLLLITALGVTGAGVSLIFALYGAIDVAITQLMVETLVVVIIAVALLKLPPITLRREAGARRRRAWNILISAVLGVSSTFAVLAIMQGDIDLKITRYFEQTSATVAHGRNIVNVILVDFRALDTMGEIAVVAIAGLAALALLAVKTRPLKDIDE